jgi:hypothetical protein
MLHEMQVDKQRFPINTMELQQPKVLVQSHQAEATKGKNVVVGEAKPDLRGKESTREVAYEKTLDGRETFKITIKAFGHGGKGHPRRLVSNQPNLSRTGRSDNPYPWSPKDVCSEATEDWKLEAQCGKESWECPKAKCHL